MSAVFGLNIAPNKNWSKNDDLFEVIFAPEGTGHAHLDR
jgi:hypothetical protein